MEKVYNPKEVEDKIYQFWSQTGFFNPDKLPKRNKNPYCIVLPPPNVTGELHMGHTLNAIIQDILIRKKRMEGYKTLWVPGIDHAGIATQNVVEKKLKKEGKTRFDLGKEKFIEEVWNWKKEYGNKILDQFKKLGISCDWSRTKFTMDEDYSKAVKEAFLHYYKKGWIYRGKRVVNWCPRCATSLSDLEVEYAEKEGTLWYLKYPLVGKEEKFIVVATTRPETMLGDQAVAVNPKDSKYRKKIGKKAILPILNKEIPIIADILVDKNFGTGAVKVTPAHDWIDFQIAQKHNLEISQVISEEGKMINVPSKYLNLPVEQARNLIIEDLKKQNLIEKEESYFHKIPQCYRCHTTLEVLPSLQWFLKMDKLAKLAKEAVKKGKVKFYPKSFEKPYFEWFNNIRDWCISRQIWWGHKIPLENSEDVLDTWFSSALWPFAVLGWPQKTKDLKTFYPTNFLATGRDILNLWVARMIFSSIEFTGKIPFRDVYIHPTILTKEGQRMSKSLGTGIDPLKLIEAYGTDATRFGIIYQATGNQDIRFNEDVIITGKKFCNKIWNASRFVMLNLNNKFYKIEKPSPKTNADKKILSSLKETVKKTEKSLENYQFGKAAHILYDFFWHSFCDFYIEEAKKQKNENTDKILLFVLLTSLKILHPFLPFITEEIYQNLPLKNKKRCIMIEEWPKL